MSKLDHHVPRTKRAQAKESKRVTEMLSGKKVSRIERFRSKEIMVEFKDGTRLYVDWQADGLELSLTEGVDASTPE